MQNVVGVVLLRNRLYKPLVIDDELPDASEIESDDDFGNLPYPPMEEHSGLTRRRLESMDQWDFLAAVQKAICDMVGDAAEGVRPAEEYLPLFDDIVMVWDDYDLPRGCSCNAE